MKINNFEELKGLKKGTEITLIESIETLEGIEKRQYTLIIEKVNKKSVMVRNTNLKYSYKIVGINNTFNNGKLNEYFI